MSVRETRSVTIRVRQEVGEGQRFCISVFHNYTLPRKGGEKNSRGKEEKKKLLSVFLRVSASSCFGCVFCAYLIPSGVYRAGSVFWLSRECVSIYLAVSIRSSMIVEPFSYHSFSTLPVGVDNHQRNRREKKK